MSRRQPNPSRAAGSATTLLGIVLLVAAVGWSLARVLTNHQRLFDPAEETIRIAHWQLELGYRSALQHVIDEYQRMQWDAHRRRVKVVQMPVTERVYGSWLTTHLISGDAPDLIEMGISQLSVQDQYIVRYILPLTDVAGQPNPYNAGTDLAGVPWRETFVDGMRGGYRPLLQDYFGAPTALNTARVFYNKSMLKAATGSDAPPKTFGQLMDACASIRELGRVRGRDITPVTGGGYSAAIFLAKYVVPFTSSYEPSLDLDLDGELSPIETYIGLTRRRVTMGDPAVRGFYACMKTLCDEFGQGFFSVDRQSSAFAFVQGQAAMLVSGSWDAQSLWRQTHGKFDVGVMDFPLPAAGEPWGDLISGRANEAAATGSAVYGVYKASARGELATDFLRFLTSQKFNGSLNRDAGWPPVVVGADAGERMTPFMPDPRGYTACLRFDCGVVVAGIYNGQLQRFLQGEIDYDHFRAAIEQALNDPVSGGDHAWAQEYDAQVRQCRTQERVLAVQSTRQLMDRAALDATPKLRGALLQQVRLNNGERLRYRYKLYRGGEIPPP